MWLHNAQSPSSPSQVKSEITEIVNFLRNPRKFLSMGARSPAGILLVGPPGAAPAPPCPCLLIQEVRRANDWASGPRLQPSPCWKGPLWHCTVLHCIPAGRTIK